MKFYKDLLTHLQKNYDPKDHLIVMGDLNISPQDIRYWDWGRKQKRWLRTGKCSFLPEEREMLSELTDWGLFDSYRTLIQKKMMNLVGSTIEVKVLKITPRGA